MMGTAQVWTPSQRAVRERRVGALEKEVEESDYGFSADGGKSACRGSVLIVSETFVDFGPLLFSQHCFFGFFCLFLNLFSPYSFVITGRGMGFIRF